MTETIDKGTEQIRDPRRPSSRLFRGARGEDAPTRPDSGGKGDWLRNAGFRIAGVLVAILALLCGGCQGTPKVAKMPAGEMPRALVAGDVVKLTFFGNPELNQSQRVRADGTISLPLIGQVRAVGKNIGEFQDELSNKYKPHLANTEVLISLESSATAVYVSGAVNKPGKIVLYRPMTVLEAIMEAGGRSELGDLKKVALIRNANGKHNSQIFDLSRTLKGEPASTFYVRPYDMIFVPERFF